MESDSIKGFGEGATLLCGEGERWATEKGELKAPLSSSNLPQIASFPRVSVPLALRDGWADCEQPNS